MKTFVTKDNNIKLINDDCITVMQAMIENNISVDCIVVDPAYRTSARGGHGNSGGMLKSKTVRQGKIFEHNDCPVDKWMPLAYDVLKEDSHCYIMTNHRNLVEYLNVAEECGFHFVKSLIWDKGNKIMGQCYMSQFEYILFFRKGAHKRINNCGTSDILSIPNKKSKGEDGKNLHDTEKPVELMEILINNSTNEGDIVLDFMQGIGATGLACQKNNRKYIGIELDEKYFDISVKRLEGKL